METELRSIFSVVLALLLLGLLIGALIRAQRRSRSASDSTWEELLGRLSWVDRDNIATVAMDVITESGEPRREENSFVLEPSTIWDLVGGLEGLETMERNCQVLVELAAYVQRWYPEALVVAEQLRLNAREIEWHIGRIKGAARTGNFESSFGDYAQRAVAIYYLMTKHVLDLYAQGNLPGLAQLQQAL